MNVCRYFDKKFDQIRGKKQRKSSAQALLHASLGLNKFNHVNCAHFSVTGKEDKTL